LWRMNFGTDVFDGAGSISSGPLAIPEPESIDLLLIAGVAFSIGKTGLQRAKRRQIKFRMIARHSYSSPAVVLLVLMPAPARAQVTQVYANDFQGDVGSEWSVTSTDVTPVGA